MVQITSYDSSSHATEYWKLQTRNWWSVRRLRDKLHDKNFKTPKSATKARLLVLSLRYQRGLLSYESMPLRELKLYAAQRGINVAPKTTPNALKALLESADNDATFDRFSDLPPELRRVIFVHYFNSFLRQERYDSNKVQPPITRASRNTRQESLPLFYNYTEHWIHLSQTSSDGPYKFTDGYHSGRFLRSIGAQNFASIRRLNLSFGQHISYRIDLHNKEDPTKLHLGYGYLDTQLEQDRLDSELRTLTLSILARQGPLELRISDIEETGEVMRRLQPKAYSSRYPWQ